MKTILSIKSYYYQYEQRSYHIFSTRYLFQKNTFLLQIILKEYQYEVERVLFQRDSKQSLFTGFVVKCPKCSQVVNGIFRNEFILSLNPLSIMCITCPQSERRTLLWEYHSPLLEW